MQGLIGYSREQVNINDVVEGIILCISDHRRRVEFPHLLQVRNKQLEVLQASFLVLYNFVIQCALCYHVWNIKLVLFPPAVFIISPGVGSPLSFVWRTRTITASSLSCCRFFSLLPSTARFGRATVLCFVFNTDKTYISSARCLEKRTWKGQPTCKQHWYTRYLSFCDFSMRRRFPLRLSYASMMTLTSSRSLKDSTFAAVTAAATATALFLEGVFFLETHQQYLPSQHLLD